MSFNDINNTNINNIVNEIGTLFTNSAQASFSAKQVHAYSKPVSNKNKRWFNNDCKKARKNFHRAKFLYKLHRTEAHKNIKSKIYKQTLSKSFNFFQNQNAYVLKKMCKSNPKQFWKYLNPRKTSKCKSSLKDMFEYFKNINSENTNVNNHNSEEQHSNISKDSFDHDFNDSILNCEISIDEIKSDIDKLKNGKACGDNNIVNEYLQSSVDCMMNVYYILFNMVFKSGIIYF